MAYIRWSSKGNNPCPLYVWIGSDGLHIWKSGQDDSDGLFFKDGPDTKVAEALITALYDHLSTNNVKVSIKKGVLTTKKMCRKGAT